MEAEQRLSDRRTRQIAGSRLGPGGENPQEVYQAAQNQLLAIQAEQKQNLAMERVRAGAIADNNNNLMQAASIAAESAAGQGVYDASINPATQQILSQFGYKQPSVKKTHSERSTQQIAKQNITINNYTTNTTSTTNNNIQAGAGGPIQGRALSINQDSTGKFKVWLSNVFAKQNEINEKRDREYIKREGNLTRSANRMMRKLEEAGSAVADRLDPRRINKTFGDQLKTILLLFGFGALAKNWPKILKWISELGQGFKEFFGFGLKGNEKSGLAITLTKILGGDPNKHDLGTALKNFFGDLFDLLKDRLALLWKDRQRVISTLEKPGSFLLNPGDTIDYLIKILGVLITGSKGAVKNHYTNISREKEDKIFLNTDKTRLFSDNRRESGSEAANILLGVGANITQGTNNSMEIPASELSAKFRLVDDSLKKEDDFTYLRSDNIAAFKKLGLNFKTEDSNLYEGHVYRYSDEDENGNLIWYNKFITPNDPEWNDKKPDPKSGIVTEYYKFSKKDLENLRKEFGRVTGLGDSFTFAEDDEKSQKALRDLMFNERKKIYKDNATSRSDLKESEVNYLTKINKEYETEIDRWKSSFEKNYKYLSQSKKNVKQMWADSKGADEKQGDGLPTKLEKELPEEGFDFEATKKKLFEKAGGRPVYKTDEQGNSTGEVDYWEGFRTSAPTISRCLNAVHEAWNAGGLYPNYTTNSPDKIPRAFEFYDSGRMEAMGYEKINAATNKYQDGDVRVFAKKGEHTSGHICMYLVGPDGKGYWYSDFQQQNADGNIYTDAVSSALYRYVGKKKGDIEPEVTQNETGVEVPTEQQSQEPTTTQEGVTGEQPSGQTTDVTALNDITTPNATSLWNLGTTPDFMAFNRGTGYKLEYPIGTTVETAQNQSIDFKNLYAVVVNISEKLDMAIETSATNVDATNNVAFAVSNFNKTPTNIKQNALQLT